MRARDQSSIFSTGGKFRPDYGLLWELHALTLVVRSYALLVVIYIPDEYDSVQCASFAEEQPEAKTYHQSEARYIC